MNRPLDSIRVSIPRLWEQEEDLREAIEDMDAAEQPLMRLQVELVRLLKEAQGAPPSPELFSWLILWTRTFQAIEGVRGAYQRRSTLTCRILERTSFETALHVGVIRRPMDQKDVRLSEGLAAEACRERLRAYFGWCLWNDLQEWRQFLHPENLKKVYEPRSARDYVRDFGDLLTQFAPWLGEPPETFTDAEAVQDEQEAVAAARQRVALLDSWLSDDRLQPWRQDLDRRKPRSFPELFDEDDGSVLDVLKGLGTAVGYSIYRSGSRVIHGASVERILFFSPSVLGPAIWESDEGIAPSANVRETWSR